ncbi:MAG: hypothetical protein A2X36_09870 [Elusimicrobia bacterium GWA2_69_24]|nr:MAG: hypothetical protein A2X36_09870 [Elusimicrobia bacterium GWA2_69_24]
MPRVWLFNVEEVAPEEDLHFDRVFTPKVAAVFPRFLFCLEPGDLTVAPVPVPEDFARYAAAVNGLPEDLRWLRTLPRRTRPYSIVTSILADRRGIFAELRGLGKAGGWQLEPYYQSHRILELSRKTGIPFDPCSAQAVLSGVILELNDKAYFKALMSLVGVPTVRGYLAYDRESLRAAMDRAGKDRRSRIMVKKTRYGGGIGNLSGTPASIRRRLRGWYGGGDVIVEPFLRFASVAGSLATISSGGVRYHGVDEQVFAAGRWAGFRYPHRDDAASRRIRELTLRVARQVRAKNARGDINLDWGILRGGSGRSIPLALECNFRHNGFGYLMRFARRFFGPRAGRMHIRYTEAFPLRPALDTLQALREAAGKLRIGGEPVLIDHPGLKRGAVIMMPPARGACAMAVFGDTPRYADRAAASLRDALG